MQSSAGQVTSQGSIDRQALSANLTKRLQAAVAAKQDLIMGLESSLSQARHQTSAYEARSVLLSEWQQATRFFGRVLLKGGSQRVIYTRPRHLLV